MDGGVVAVGGFVVGLAGGEVEGAGDFFVEEDIAHGAQDMRVEAKGEFTDVAGACIGVQDFVEGFFVSVAMGFDDFAVFEAEAHAIEGDAVVDAGGVVGDGAVDAVAHGGGVDFAIGDVAVAAAGNGGYAFDGEAEVGAGAGDADSVCLFHELLEVQHGIAHGGVVCQAAAEVEVFEVFGAHAGSLGHAGGGPGENGPFAAVAGDIAGGFEMAADDLHAFAGHIGAFEGVGIGVEADVHLHVFGALQAVAAIEFVLFIGGAGGEFFGDEGVREVDVGDASRAAYGADEFDDHGIGDVLHAEVYMLAGLYAHGVVDDLFGQLGITGILHGE